MVSHHFAPEPGIRLTGSRAGDAFSVSFRRDGTRSVVTVAGELDVATAAQLDGVLRCLCSPADGDLEVDAGEMSFCDCQGLAVLLHAAERRRKRGQRLTVTHASPSLRRLIGLTGASKSLLVSDEPSRR